MALKLYVSGAARTQAEAAEATGVSKQAISIARNTPTGRRLEAGFDDAVQERAVSLSAVIAKLSEKALMVMEEQIENGSTEEVRFKAAKDILDRNPETSKTNKVQVESFTLGSRDAKELAAALLEGRATEQKFKELESADYVRVDQPPEAVTIMGEPKHE